MQSETTCRVTKNRQIIMRRTTGSSAMGMTHFVSMGQLKKNFQRRLLLGRGTLAAVLSLALPAFAAAPPSGSPRLRDLVVFPRIAAAYNYGLNLFGDRWAVSVNANGSEISGLRDNLSRQPGDAESLLKLGALLEYQNDAGEVRDCYQQAEAICRKRAAANPENGGNLDNLAEALWGQGKDEEAESLYRRATLVSSNDWQCWARLGNFLSFHQLNSVLPENFRDQPVVGQPPAREILDYRPSESALSEAEDSLREGGRCFDRAVALAPKEAQVYVQRAGYLTASNWESCLFSHWRNNGPSNPDAWLSFLSAGTIANLEKAAALDPNNSDAIALPAYFEWVQNGTEAKAGPENFDALPPESRRLILGALGRLTDCAQDPDKKAAAKAFELLGFLNWTMKDPQSAAVNFQRAILLDPSRERSWDLLLLSLQADHADIPFRAVCEARLKFNDTARNHLLLARACVAQEKWNEAQAQSQLAADADTNNATAPLFQVALALKRDLAPDDLSQIQDQLNDISGLIGRMTPGPAAWMRWRELSLDSAIFYGLENTADSQRAALGCLAQVMKYYPTDETARNILEALKGEGPLNNFESD